MKESKITIINYNDISFEKHIGQGLTSDVYRGTYKNNKYAFKVYTTENEVWKNKDIMLESFNYEIKTAQKCIGLNQTVQTKGYCSNEDNGIFSIIIMMELLDSIGDLKDYLDQSMFWYSRDDLKPCSKVFGIFNYDENTFWEYQLSEKCKQKIALDIITSVKEIHNHKIIHGDIKSHDKVGKTIFGALSGRSLCTSTRTFGTLSVTSSQEFHRNESPLRGEGSGSGAIAPCLARLRVLGGVRSAR